jgi:hypothetical protein
MLFCGIDTSNYTTSAALCDENGNIVANLKIPLPVKAGEKGLRQSDAVFSHIKNLPELTARLKAELGCRKLTAVAVSARPRDIEDSYMPCFLSGVSAAEMLSVGAGVPLYRTSHQQGHVMAAYATSGADKDGVLAKHDAFIAASERVFQSPLPQNAIDVALSLQSADKSDCMILTTFIDDARRADWFHVARKANALKSLGAIFFAHFDAQNPLSRAFSADFVTTLLENCNADALMAQTWCDAFDAEDIETLTTQASSWQAFCQA